jgi:hypothetical protein
MPEFQVGDIVRVELPRGYSNRGILGISLLFSTSPESRFEGAIGSVAEINPVGPQMVHQYLVDFRTYDNSRVGIPWQAQWFREEWLALQERPESVVRAAATGEAPEATWPERPAAEQPPAVETAPAAGGIAHPEAKIFTEGRTDFAPEGLSPEEVTGTVPESAYGARGTSPVTEAARSSPGAAGGAESAPAESSQAFTGADRVDDRSGLDAPTFQPTPESMTSPVDTTTPSSAPGTIPTTAEPMPAEQIVEHGEGFVRLAGALRECPEGFPIKGNASSGIFHAPTDHAYQRTIPQICFASEDIAIANGFRAPARRG